MGENEQWQIRFPHIRQRCLDVVPPGPEVADTRDPDGTGGGVDCDGAIFEDRDTGCLEGSLDPPLAQPDIMVAKNRENTCARFEGAEFPRYIFRRNERSTPDTMYDQIAKNEDNIRGRGIRPRNDLLKPGNSVVG
jgi:hypothetical protein